MTPFNDLERLINRNLDIFEELLVPVENFKAWLEDNEAVYDAYKKYAWELKSTGNRVRYGSPAIIERVRWDTMIRESSVSGFKINNNWSSFMGRLLMLELPTHFSEFFATRVQRRNNSLGDLL